jgi:hypothetical protein
LALAARVLKETESDKAAVARVFQLTYGRAPQTQEVVEAVSFWRKMNEVQSKIKYEARKPPTTVVRRAKDENTGEPFTFTERLFGYETYIPDLAPHQVDARTRGLADLCLAILNSNEFAFVY